MARTAAAYAEETDLLLGDMPLSSAISIPKFMNDTADEIDVRLGGIYSVPFNISNPGPLEASAVTTLRLLNARLASGRLLMAQAQAAQDDNLHAYAMYLIKEAETMLANIEAGRLALDGAEYVGAEAGAGPTILNHDEYSPVDAFEQAFMGGSTALGVTPIWRPGGGG